MYSARFSKIRPYMFLFEQILLETREFFFTNMILHVYIYSF